MTTYSWVMALGEKYRREISEQPLVLESLLRDGRADIEAIAQEIRLANPRYGLFAARGSSDNAARYAQYLFGVHNQLTCALATPSVFTAYASSPDLRGSLTIGISQSGQSPDVVSVVAAAAKQGAMTLGITNDTNSPLAKAAKWIIPLRAGHEGAIPATKTYTSQLMAIAMVSAALEGEKAWAVLDTIPGAVRSTIELNAFIQGIDALAGLQHLVVIGRGFNYASACEIALKISETSSVVALPYSMADFLHGPIAVLAPGTKILLVAPRGAFDAQVAEFLELEQLRQAQLIAISNEEDVLARADVALEIPQVPEWISPICAAVVGQLFSAALACAKNQDPDEPHGLSKVTLTY